MSTLDFPDYLIITSYIIIKFEDDSFTFNSRHFNTFYYEKLNLTHQSLNTDLRRRRRLVTYN